MKRYPWLPDWIIQDKRTLKTTLGMEHLSTINILCLSQNITNAGRCRGRKRLHHVTLLNHSPPRSLPITTVWEGTVSVNKSVFKTSHLAVPLQQMTGMLAIDGLFGEMDCSCLTGIKLFFTVNSFLSKYFVAEWSILT